MKAIACIVLIIGLLKFATDAPELLKNIFSSGGDLLKGMDLNPHGQLRRQAEPAIHAAGRIGSTVAGGIGGLAAGAARAHKNANGDFDAAENGSGRGRGLHRGLATIGGGLRGMIRGGAHGFQNASDSATPRNMYNQLMSGTDQGQIAAQQASANYREGNSTNLFGRMFTRAGNRITDFRDEHIVNPAVQFGQSVTNQQTSNEAAQIFDNMKTNNTAAMTATGTDTAVGNLKTARDNALQKVRDARAAGADIDELKNELHINDASITDYKGLEDAIKNNFTTQKRETLDARFTDDSKISDETLKIIQQWNNDTITNFERNASLMSERDLQSIVKKMNTEMHLGLGLTASGDIADLNGGLQSVIDELKKVNSCDTASERAYMRANGADLMMNLSTLQSQMETVKNDISYREARSAATNPAPAAGGDNSGGGNS